MLITRGGVCDDCGINDAIVMKRTRKGRTRWHWKLKCLPCLMDRLAAQRKLSRWSGEVAWCAW